MLAEFVDRYRGNGQECNNETGRQQVQSSLSHHCFLTPDLMLKGFSEGEKYTHRYFADVKGLTLVEKLILNAEYRITPRIDADPDRPPR
jgi:hypothetical protein